jgi:hypothetical protein
MRYVDVAKHRLYSTDPSAVSTGQMIEKDKMARPGELSVGNSRPLETAKVAAFFD